MRHHHKGRTLGRDKNQRAALLRSLARSLVIHERISTTDAKARELRPFIEKLVTRAKTDTVANRRLDRVGDRAIDRPARRGDAAGPGGRFRLGSTHTIF